MSGATLIKAKGRVVEVLPKLLYRVEMANGHRVLGYLSRAMRTNLIRVDSGDQVSIEMSPFDMSKGRIISKEQ